MTDGAPGAWQPSADRWGRFDELWRELPERAVVVLDRRVAKLHGRLCSALKERSPLAVVELAAGERAKGFAALKRVLEASVGLTRSGTLVAIGGGTIGDLATVAAHLLKRGVRLVHVPTTLLAAVDSSVGGKGALNLGSGAYSVKNAAGVFHYADACLLCPELFETLSSAQRREGAMEAWKMAATLDSRTWEEWRLKKPELRAMVERSRTMKSSVCEADPYERRGIRQVLNFGHTFGHVLESLTHHRMRHGDAVGLGMHCALDVGRAMGVTGEALAAEVERGLSDAGSLGREHLARALKGANAQTIRGLLEADKKNVSAGEVRMVLLREVGRTELSPVPAEVWTHLLAFWKRGRRP